MSAFYEKTGWPAGGFKDTDGVFETEKRLADSFPIRNVSLLLMSLMFLNKVFRISALT